MLADLHIHTTASDGVYTPEDIVKMAETAQLKAFAITDHEEINNGIIRCFQEGCLTSTSLMCGAPAFNNAVALLKNNEGLGVGVHLTLVGGVAPVLPVEEVKSLVDENGLFFSDYTVFIKNFYLGKVKKNEIKRELEAQLLKAASTGLKFTHVVGFMVALSSPNLSLQDEFWAELPHFLQ